MGFCEKMHNRDEHGITHSSIHPDASISRYLQLFCYEKRGLGIKIFPNFSAAIENMLPSALDEPAQ